MIHQWVEIDTPKGSYRQILDGKHPTLIWDKDCPVAKGDEVYLSSSLGLDGNPIPTVWIQVTGLTRTKKGGTMIQYTVRDDRPLYLSGGSNHIMGKGYTRSAGHSVDPGAPVLDPETYRLITEETLSARLRKAEAKTLKDNDDPKKKARAINDRLKVCLKGLEPTAQLELVAGIQRLILETEANA